MNQRWLEVLAGLLEPEEREAVLGDLAESNKSSYTSLRDLAGLVIRRQMPAWRRPGSWLVLLGTSTPATPLTTSHSRPGSTLPKMAA